MSLITLKQVDFQLIEEETLINTDAPKNRRWLGTFESSLKFFTFCQNYPYNVEIMNKICLPNRKQNLLSIYIKYLNIPSLV